MEITIRDSRPSGVDAIHEILVADSTIAGSMRQPYQAKVETVDRLEQKERMMRLVAEIDDELVGFVELATHPNAPRHRHVGVVNLIAVREDHQGNGVGRRLMDAIIDLADNWLQITRLELFVWTTNHNAARLYKSPGFEQEGTLRDYAFFDGRFLDAYITARFRPWWRS